MATHCPFQLGYFASSAARAPPIVAASTAANTNTPAELPYSMMNLPAWSRVLIALDALIWPGEDIPPTAWKEWRQVWRGGAPARAKPAQPNAPPASIAFGGEGRQRRLPRRRAPPSAFPPRYFVHLSPNSTPP